MAENNNNNNGELPNNFRYTSSCAACKHQRRKCQKDCLFAPYFSYKETQEFIAVHKLFGVSNLSKKLKSLDVRAQRDRVAESIKWEAMKWELDPMNGPLGYCERLRAKAEELTAQFEEQKNQIELLSMKIEQQKAQIELLKAQIDEQQRRKNHGMMCLDDQETVGNGAARVVLSSGSTSTNHNDGDLEVHQIVPPETKILFNGSGPVDYNRTAHGVSTNGTSSNHNNHEINLELSQMVPNEPQIHHYNNNGTDHSQVTSNWTTRGETSYGNGDMLPPSSSVNSHTQGVGRDHQGNGNGHMVNVPTAPPHYSHHIQIQSQGMSFSPTMSRPLQAQDITRSNGQNKNGGPRPWPYTSHVQAHLLEIGSQQARGNNGDSYGMNFHQNGYGGVQRMGNGTNGVANTSQQRRSNGTGGRESGIVNHSINGRAQNGGGLGSGVANPSINGRGQEGMLNHVGGVHTGVNFFDNHGVVPVGHGRPTHTSAPNPTPQGQQSNQQDLGAVLGPPNWHYGNGGN